MLQLELSNIGAYVLTVTGSARQRFEAGTKYFLSYCFHVRIESLLV